MFLSDLLGAFDRGKNISCEAVDSVNPGPRKEHTRRRPGSELQCDAKPWSDLPSEAESPCCPAEVGEPGV